MAYRIVSLTQDTEKWHAFRSGKIGSSMASAIVNENPWKTPLALWEECVFEKPIPMTAAMQRGKDLEPIARSWINEKWNVVYLPAVIQSVEYPSLFASLDGFYEKEGHPHLLEIKCPGAADHAEALSGRIPKHYSPQLQHQMMIAGVDHMFYLSFVGEDADNVVLLAQRNAEYCKMLLLEELRFLDQIISLIPPDPQEKDWVEVDTPELVKKGAYLWKLKALRKRIEAKQVQLENEIKAELTHPRSKIGPLKAQKLRRRGNIDYSKIEELMCMDLEPYRRPPSEYWRFS